MTIITTRASLQPRSAVLVLVLLLCNETRLIGARVIPSESESESDAMEHSQRQRHHARYR